jgi:pimeloyl-ACP methyl ester carboxylesterase
MELHYRILGEGQPFIILHGLFGISDNWQTIAKKLSEKYKVVLVDQRNHGHSGHSEEWNYKAMSKDLHELISKENLSQCILMGHSMGGKAAMQFAFDHPDELSKLIVVDIGPKQYPVHQRDIVDALKTVDLSVLKSRKEVDDHMATLISDYGTRQFLLKNLYWANDTQLAWRFNLDVIDKNLAVVGNPIESETDHSDIDTLFIRGSKSNYIKDEDFEGIKKLFPSSKIETVEGAGHWVHADKPVELLNIIQQFLN